MQILTTDRFLFLFAHPDDDTFICGTMKMLLEAGAEVHAAWLTSGDYFGQGELREAELARAMEILGLDELCIHLLRLPDLGLIYNMDEGIALVADLLGTLKPDSVFVTAFEGGHPDHDAVNYLCYEGCTRAGVQPRLFEFPLYNGTGPVRHWRWRINDFGPGGPETLYSPLNEGAIDCKYRMMKTYSSQWMYMVPARLASSRSRLRTLGEPYRSCPADRDHAVPPHPGTLNYERWFNFFIKIRFADFAAEVEKSLSSVVR